MSEKIVELDSIGSLERIFNRDYNSSKFVIACYLNESQLASYISSEISEMELCYLISELQRRYREKYE